MSERSTSLLSSNYDGVRHLSSNYGTFKRHPTPSLHQIPCVDISPLTRDQYISAMSIDEQEHPICIHLLLCCLTLDPVDLTDMNLRWLTTNLVR
eukprot:scaffold1344_cov232-Alexandrium_tamarense.AAC.5